MDVIKVEKRDLQAKVKQLRRSGLVPCCVYGGALPEACPLQMRQPDAQQLVRVKRPGSKLRLDLEGRLIPVQIKDMTRACAGGAVEHIQFQALQADQKVNSVAHVLLKKSENVSGVVEQLLFEIPFASLPQDMIDTVTVDLDDLAVGTVLAVRDIPAFCDPRIELQLSEDSIVLRLSDKKRALPQDGQ